MERILGKIEGEYPGPLVICIAALHGNEQIGLHAFRNVFSAIKNNKIRFRGKLLGVIGNLKALTENKRYIDYDLNRAWVDDKVYKALNSVNGHSQAEDEELRSLYHIIQEESVGDFTTRILADLHATSADKGNFVVVPEDESNHHVIKAVKLPVVVDLDKYLRGTLLSYYNKKGYISFAFEGGMIGTEGVYNLHTSGLWEILDKVGCISHHDHEREDHYARQLLEVSEELPRKVKVLFRYRIHKGEGFRMLPGFHNFQKVEKGQMLAINNEGEIHSPYDGLIFLPLYQNDGEDGFFIVEETPDSHRLKEEMVFE